MTIIRQIVMHKGVGFIQYFVLAILKWHSFKLEWATFFDKMFPLSRTYVRVYNNTTRTKQMFGGVLIV